MNPEIPWRLPNKVSLMRRGSPPPPNAIRLSSNESPFPPPEPVVQAIAEAASACNRYSFGTEGPMLSALGSWLDVEPGRIVTTNGSAELLDRVIGALGTPGAEIVYPEPSFPIFAARTASSGATAVPVALRNDGGNDLEAMAEAVTDATVLVIVCNPNNPTGTHLPALEVGKFLEELPERPLVLIDEAYFEFSDEYGIRSCIDVAARHPNTLVTRTFSKFFGLAGLRVGYGVAPSPEVAADIRLQLGTANIGRVALAGALAALEAIEVAEARRAFVVSQRERMTAVCAELGLDPFPSATNFVLCREPSPGAVDAIRARGLWIRDGESVRYPGMMRMTVGSEEDVDRLVAALREVAG